MKKELVEKLIKEGKSSQEIRKKVIGFPYKPSKGYFRKLGCEDEVAEKYESILQKRDSMCSEERFEFIASQNVDLNNLIIDTCVFGHDKTIELIENAKNVIILLSTLNEMDKKKDVNQEDLYSRKMAEKIRWYSNLFLVDKEKYHLIPFAGYEKNMYPDDVIIQYLSITEATKRPTILTADTILANKADAFGLEYILYKPVEFVLKRKENNVADEVFETTNIEKNSIAQEEKILNSKRKRDNTYSEGGIEISLEGTNVIVKRYNDNAKVFYLKEGEYKEIEPDEQQIEQSIEELILVIPVARKGSIHVVKLNIKDGKLLKQDKEYVGLNKMYIDEWIDESIKDKITDIIY